MSLQSLEGLVLNVMDSRSCFHLVCCSCKTSDISLFSICILLVTSCEGNWHLRGFIVRILCLIFLLKPLLKCLTAPVGIWSLLCLVIVLVRCVKAMLMSGKLSMLKSVIYFYLVRKSVAWGGSAFAIVAPPTVGALPCGQQK